MVRLIANRHRRARKDYRCSSCEYVRDYYEGHSDRVKLFTNEEWLAVMQARANNWTIRKGDTYLYQFLTDGSDTWSFKCIEAMHNICLTYKLYPEE